MPFTLRVMPEAKQMLENLGRTDIKKRDKVRKTLALLQSNPRHQGLHTHEYDALQGENGEKVWEAYVENKTPAAYRVFWHYGPEKGQITIVSITPHP